MRRLCDSRNPKVNNDSMKTLHDRRNPKVKELFHEKAPL
jgi:hypothetical protein